MVMEPNQTDETQVNVNKYTQDIPVDYPQPNQHAENSIGTKMQSNPKADSANFKNFQPTSDNPVSGDQFKNVQQRPFGQNFSDSMQRPPGYPDASAMAGSLDRPPYPQSATMPGSNNVPLTVSTPTLNQLLTQNPHPPKYPTSAYGGDYANTATNVAASANAPNMYDSWNTAQPNASNSSMYSSTMSPVRPGMPVPNRPMAPHSMQMSSMYDRASQGQPMHPGYRHPGSQFVPPGDASNYRMMGPHHQGFVPHPVNLPMDGNQTGGESGEMDSTSHQRVRPSMMAAGRAMGPPRAPAPHQMEPSGGQMMPPPNQNQGYPGMHPFGSQPYRNNQMPPYQNYPSNQVGSQIARGQPPNNFSQGPINHQPMPTPQVNGPSHKAMPSSPIANMNQSSPGGSMRGISPAPAQQMSGLAASPASSTGQPHSKALSPCPSPSVGSHRSMPPSPISASVQMNSPHPGLSPRPESVPSPRTDVTQSTMQPEQIATVHPSSTTPQQKPQPVNSNQPSMPEQQQQMNGKPDQQQAQMASTHGQASLQSALPQQQQQQQHMMMNHQSQPQQHGRMLPSGAMPGSPALPGGVSNQQPPSSMGNGMAPYHQQRMPLAQPTAPHYQNRPPGPSAYPPSGAPPQMGLNQNSHLPYPGPGLNYPTGSWPTQQNHQPPTAGGIYSTKNDKTAVSSPLAAVQSPAAASPHSSEGSRRPSARKSDSGGGKKPVPPNTVHGTNMDVFNRQVDLGPAPEHPLRKQFMDHLCAFYLETTKPLMTMPCIGKNPLDLYKVYTMVKEKGGFQQVCKKKLWKQVGTAVAASTAANAAYTLKKAYIKFLLNYECRFERGGIDPQIVLSSVETKKERQNRNAPSPGSSSNSQEAHMRNYPDYGMGPGMHHPGHPAHMGGGQMRPGQFHDPNMPPHQQHYMNYNNMGGGPPTGMPNGHHPMPPQQPSSIGADDQQQMSSQSDASTDSYRHQQMNSQYPNQQPMGGPGYPPRHPYYGPRMPPGGQRPPFHQQPTPSPGLQQQPVAPPNTAHMRMPHPQSQYPPMYRDSSYPNSQQPGMTPTPSSHSNAYPGGMDTHPNRPATSVYSQSSAAGATPSHISASAAAASPNMGHSMQHASPATPIPRYPSRGGHQTATRGALSAMLSNSSASAGLEAQLSVDSFTDSLSSGCDSGGVNVARPWEMPPPPLPASTAADHCGGSQLDIRASTGSQWRQRTPMPPPGYSSSAGSEHTSRRQLPMMRQAAPPKKEIVFPPGSVEATQPSKVRPRVIQSKDIGKCDPWKLVMCLRSGLLCESIWALDTITVMLRDEHMHSVSFSLRNMPGLLDILIAHYKQSLALLFEELSGLVHTDPGSHTDSIDTEDYELADCKQLLLHSANYSWTSRSGLKVIVDSDLNKEHMIPSPSMYSRKPYTSRKIDHIVVSSFESEGTKEFYTKQFRKHIKLDKKYEDDEGGLSTPVSTQDTLLKEDDVTTISSPTATSTSLTSGGTSDFSSQSTITEKRLLPEGGALQFPQCNGCFNGDIKGDSSEHSCESSDVTLPKLLDTPIRVVNTSAQRESSIDRKMAESARDLEALEAKLSISRKRRFSETIDVEPILRDDPPLECEVDRKLQEISIRCTTLSNIIRGLSFIVENEKLMAENKELLGIFGRLLNLKIHVDPEKDKRCWWWPALEALREHTLVTISNVAGHLQLIDVSHEICFPLLDSLLFWATSSAAYARDPLPHTHNLSIRNLVMEILCKLCAHSDNMNLLLATPPTDRISQLFQCLAKLLTEPDQVRREFALVIISCLSQADSMAARGLALQPSCISQLISILESAESAAFSIAQQRGVGALRENPEAMGTSLDMIRRTSATLVEMAQVKENHSILLRQQDRLLNLVMSQILDQHVAKMLSDVLYECTKDSHIHMPPSYIISRSTEASIVKEEGKTKIDSLTAELTDEPAVKRRIQEDTKDIAITAMEHEPELDKENINKSSILESNSAIGMLSAAS